MKEQERPIKNDSVQENDVVDDQIQQPIDDDVIDEQIQRRLSDKKGSFLDRIKKSSRVIAEKGAIAKNSMAEKFAKIDAENCTLQEAMAKIERDVFAGTKILEVLEPRFMGSARKIRDQIARKTAKIIYERWNNEQEKEEMKQIIELDYDDV